MDKLKEPRLTITMPVYERKEFFLNALNSAINQTVTCDILVIDNCSSHDYFEKICKEKNIKYIKNESNIGLFPNWNKCMKIADTEYAMILQDDNILELDFVENFSNSLNTNNKIDLYFTDFNIVDLNTKKISYHNHTYPYGYFENGMKVIEYAINYNLGLLYSVIVKRSKFTEYYFKFHGSNDWLWIYENIASLTVFGNEKKLINYGTHNLQDSSNSNTHVQCMLTMTYIYDITLANQVKSNITLFEKAKNNSLSTFLYFLSIVDKQKLLELLELKESNIYCEYLNNKLNNNIILNIISKLPKVSRIGLFKIARKLKIVKPF